MKQVISYCRVLESDKPLTAIRLMNQKRIIDSYCKQEGFNVAANFEEHHNANDFERPEWKRLLMYLEDSHNVHAIICSSKDRFSRDVVEAEAQINLLKKMGVEVIIVA